MAPESKVLVVLGSGPGISRSTATLLAKKDHFNKIALLARNADRLKTEKEEIQKSAGSGVEVVAYPTDLADFDSLRKTLKEVEQFGSLSMVFFNAARIKASEILSTPVEEIDEDFRTSNLALYVTAQWAIPLLQKSGNEKPTFFVTSSHLPEHPEPFLLSLSITKASQQNMVEAFDKAFGKDIHFGIIKVNGPVKPDEPVRNPTNIGEKTVEFYEKGSGMMIHIGAL